MIQLILFNLDELILFLNNDKIPKIFTENIIMNQISISIFDYEIFVVYVFKFNVIKNLNSIVRIKKM